MRVGSAIALVSLILAGAPAPAWTASTPLPLSALPADGAYSGLPAAASLIRYEVRAGTALTGGTGVREFSAANPEQALRARFTPGGVEVTPDRAQQALDWRWGMRLTAYGYGEPLTPLGPVEILGSGNRVEYRYGSALTEWYVNTAQGIEQGFTLEGRPEGARAGLPLELALAVSG